MDLWYLTVYRFSNIHITIIHVLSTRIIHYLNFFLFYRLVSPKNMSLGVNLPNSVYKCRVNV